MDSLIFKPLLFLMKNEKLYLKNIININIFQLLCQVNEKLIEKKHIEVIDENKIHAFIILKHLFKDIGIQQYFLKLIVEFNESTQQFNIEIDNTIQPILPFQYNESLQLLNNISLSISYTNVTEHEYNYTVFIKKTKEIHEELDEELDEIVKNLIFKLIRLIFNNLNKYISEYVC